MRKYLFLMLLVTVVSCSQKNSDRVVLNFKVENMTFAKIAVANKNIVEVVNLDKNGEGSCVINKDVIYANLYYGEELKKLFLQRGDNITISFKGNQFAESMHFVGESAPILNYLNEVVYPPIMPNLLTGTLDDVLNLINNRIETADAKLESFNFENDFPQFVKLEKERIKYMYALNLVIYPMVYTMENPSYSPGAKYFSSLENYLKEDEELLEVPPYREFLIETALLFAKRDNGDSNFSNKSIVRIKYIAKNIKSTKIKESLINEIAISYVNRNGKEDIAELIKVHDTYVTDPALKAAFEEVYTDK